MKKIKETKLKEPSKKETNQIRADNNIREPKIITIYNNNSPTKEVTL